MQTQSKAQPEPTYVIIIGGVIQVRDLSKDIAEKRAEQMRVSGREVRVVSADKAAREHAGYGGGNAAGQSKGTNFEGWMI